MRPGSLFIAIIFLLMSCRSKNSLPKGILNADEMEAVLWDLSRSDQWLNSFLFPQDSSLNQKTESIKMYEQVFSLHHINKEQFEKSYTYYKEHPSLFRTILDSVTAKSNMASIDVPVTIRPVDSARFNRFRVNKPDSLNLQKPLRVRPN